MLSNRNLLKGISKDRFFKAVSMPNISLEAEEADSFLDVIVDESVLWKSANFVRMSKNTHNLRHMGISSRILFSGSIQQSDYVTELDENLIQLNAQELVGVIPLKDVDTEDLPEPNFFDRVMDLAARKISNELEEVALIGDTSTASGFGARDARKQMDGWFRQMDQSQSGETYENDVTNSTTILDASNTITGHTTDFVNAGNIAERNATSGTWEFKKWKMISELPTKYLQKFTNNDLKFYMAPKVESTYVAALESRATVLGDQAILGDQPMKYHRYGIVSTPSIPLTMEAQVADATKDQFDADNGTFSFVIFTPSKNLSVGIQRDIRIEMQRDAINRQTYVVYTIRFDAKVEDVNAAVLLKRLVYDGDFSQ